MSTFRHSREIPATPKTVFAALSDPVRLARWWGPDGFSNSFQTFEFHHGGRWLFTMHGPDGADYANESEFLEIVPDALVRIRHSISRTSSFAFRSNPVRPEPGCRGWACSRTGNSPKAVASSSRPPTSRTWTGWRSRSEPEPDFVDGGPAPRPQSSASWTEVRKARTLVMSSAVSFMSTPLPGRSSSCGRSPRR